MQLPERALTALERHTSEPTQVQQPTPPPQSPSPRKGPSENPRDLRLIRTFLFLRKATCSDECCLFRRFCKISAVFRFWRPVLNTWPRRFNRIFGKGHAASTIFWSEYAARGFGRIAATASKSGAAWCARGIGQIRRQKRKKGSGGGKMGCLPARPCTQTAGTDHRRSGKRSSSRNSARLSATRIGGRAKPSMSILTPKSEHTKLRTQRCSNRAYPRASTAVAPQLPRVLRGQADAICARTAHTHAPPPLFFVCMSARASVYASAPLRKIVVKRYTSTPWCTG